MRKLFAYSVLVSLIALTGSLAQEKKAPAKKADAPAKMVFEAKNGKVTFDHAAHSKREKEDCKICHPAPWPESAKAPLNYKGTMHKVAEEKQASCGKCHHEGGKSFAAKGNCTGKCHNNAKKS